MSVGVKDASLKPLGYEQISAPATSTALTVPTGARYALIKVSVACRWRDDGQDPTAAIGMTIDAGDEFWYAGHLPAFRIIQTAASVVDVAYYR